MFNSNRYYCVTIQNIWLTKTIKKCKSNFTFFLTASLKSYGKMQSAGLLTTVEKKHIKMPSSSIPPTFLLFTTLSVSRAGMWCVTQAEMSDRRSESGREAAVELCPCGSGSGREQPATRSAGEKQVLRHAWIEIKTELMKRMEPNGVHVVILTSFWWVLGFWTVLRLMDMTVTGGGGKSLTTVTRSALRASASTLHQLMGWLISSENGYSERTN